MRLDVFIALGVGATLALGGSALAQQPAPPPAPPADYGPPITNEQAKTVAAAALCRLTARFPTPSFGRALLARARGASCSCNGTSPILIEGSPESVKLSMNYRRTA